MSPTRDVSYEERFKGHQIINHTNTTNMFEKASNMHNETMQMLMIDEKEPEPPSPILGCFPLDLKKRIPQIPTYSDESATEDLGRAESNADLPKLVGGGAVASETPQ